jgi:hypothetical protein
MKSIIAIFVLTLIPVFAQQSSPIMECTITPSDKEGNHAECKGRNPNPVCQGRDEPECTKLTLTWDEWPKEWAGSRKPGTVYRVRWTAGEHKPLPSSTFCQDEYERRTKASRVGITEGIRHPSYFIPEGCSELLLQNRTGGVK